jgi:hypothetical protein
MSSLALHAEAEQHLGDQGAIYLASTEPNASPQAKLTGLTYGLIAISPYFTSKFSRVCRWTPRRPLPCR